MREEKTDKVVDNSLQLKHVRNGINSPDSLDNVCILKRKQVAEQDVTAEEVPVTI